MVLCNGSLSTLIQSPNPSMQWKPLDQARWSPLDLPSLPEQTLGHFSRVLLDFRWVVPPAMLLPGSVRYLLHYAYRAVVFPPWGAKNHCFVNSDTQTRALEIQDHQHSDGPGEPAPLVNAPG